jgi:hypothetical protein
METRMSIFEVYKELAEIYERKGPAPMRDRFLVLAAEAALAEGRFEEAERLRGRLLQANPHHLLKPYGSFVQALRAADVQTYVNDLRQNYPPEEARKLLNNLRGEEGSHHSPAIPPTAPLIDFNDNTLPLGEVREPLKVFPQRDQADRTEAVPAPRRPTRAGTNPTPIPRPAPAASRSAAPATPKSQPPVAPARPTPAPPPVVSTPTAAPDDAPGGGWLGMILFGIVLAIGTALATFILTRPFLPASWLP